MFHLLIQAGLDDDDIVIQQFETLEEAKTKAEARHDGEDCIYTILKQGKDFKITQVTQAQQQVKHLTWR